MESLIAGLEGVMDVQVSEANVGRFALDRHHSLQFIGVDRTVTFMVEWLVNVFRKIYEVWGDDGRRMVYLEGVYGGRRSFHTISSAFDLEGRELAEAVLEMWIVLGWAERTEIVELNLETGEGSSGFGDPSRPPSLLRNHRATSSSVEPLGSCLRWCRSHYLGLRPGASQLGTSIASL